MDADVLEALAISFKKKKESFYNAVQGKCINISGIHKTTQESCVNISGHSTWCPDKSAQKYSVAIMKL